jgi:hypothetical protein
MKYILMAGVLLFVLAGASTAARTTDPLKWSQLPNICRGTDISSNTSVASLVADDFKNCNALPITDIHWWGSYWNNGGCGFNNDQPTADATNFVLSIYSNDPAKPYQHNGFGNSGNGYGNPDNGFSHPGKLLWTYTIATVDANEALYSQAKFGGDSVYSYDVYLPGNEVKDLNKTLEKGSTYWLSIQAVLPGRNTNTQWGWHTSNTDNLSSAVQKFKRGKWSPIGSQCFGGTDMAFQLTTVQVPEPGSLGALGAGALGLVGFAFKRRRA